MKKISPALLAFFGVALAFLFSFTLLSAQDKPQPAKTTGAMGSMSMAQSGTYAPGLPGWMHHLPPDLLEKAKTIWLADGRGIIALEEMLAAKGHELKSVMTQANPDEKVTQALAKEISGLVEKLINAKIALHRKLEKEGIPTWGHHMGGMHGMIEHRGMMGMEQEGMCPMMGQMGQMGGEMKQGASMK